MASVSKVDDNNNLPAESIGRESKLAKDKQLERVQERKEAQQANALEQQKEVPSDTVEIRDAAKTQTDVRTRFEAEAEEVTSSHQAVELSTLLKDLMVKNPKDAAAAQEKIPRDSILNLFI